MTDSTFPGATPSDRFFIDDRVGCIAVRDRQRTDPEYPGLHWDTDGVVWYQHGVSGRNGWFVPPEMKEAAQKECARLNAEQASCDALKAEVQRLRDWVMSVSNSVNIDPDHAPSVLMMISNEAAELLAASALK